MYRKLAPLVFTFIIVFIAGCTREPPAPKAEVIRPAKLFTVEDWAASNLRSFPGSVSATDEAQLAFRVSGELIDLPGTRGKRVKQGELLAQLDPADYKAALQQATAQYELAKAQFQRAEELINRQLVARAEYDQRQARMRVTESDLIRAQNNLSYTSINAPFDGVVARQLVDNFESVSAGQVVLILQTGEMIDVIVDIPESIVARVERRSDRNREVPVSVRFDSAGDRMYDALYKEHETLSDAATLTFKVTFSLPTPQDINILPGMTATVIVDLNRMLGVEDTGYLVPVEAVFSAEDEPVDSPTRFVWTVDPETMRTHRTPVTVGDLSGDRIAVLDGVAAGDMLVAAGVNSIVEGTPVRPMERESGL